MAVTTNLNINFLRKAGEGRSGCRTPSLLKVGKRLVVGEVAIYSDGESGAGRPRHVNIFDAAQVVSCIGTQIPLV